MLAPIEQGAPHVLVLVLSSTVRMLTGQIDTEGDRCFGKIDNLVNEKVDRSRREKGNLLGMSSPDDLWRVHNPLKMAVRCRRKVERSA